MAYFNYRGKQIFYQEAGQGEVCVPPWKYGIFPDVYPSFTAVYTEISGDSVGLSGKRQITAGVSISG